MVCLPYLTPGKQKMIIHRLTMLTENDSSEHLLAKINPHSRFILTNQNNVKIIRRTNVNDFINT
jgi:hypothetical protein